MRSDPMKRRVVMLAAFLIGLLVTAPTMSQDKQTGVVVDKEKRTVTIDAKIAPRKLPNLDQIYPIEVIACWPTPRGQKAHETVVIFDESIKPSQVHKALESLGLKAGMPVKGPGDPKGPLVKIYLLLPEGDTFKRIPIEKSLID